MTEERMKRRILRSKKECRTHLTIVVKCDEEEHAEMLKKAIYQMILRENNLINGGVSYDVYFNIKP